MDRENCARARARKKIDHLGITQNRIGTLIRPNDEEEKRLRAKIPTGAFPGGPGNLCTRVRALKAWPSRDQMKSHWYSNWTK